MKNIKTFNTKPSIVLSTSLCALLSSLTSANVASDNVTLEEVVVTAQKREQNIQDVPISISTLSEDEIASKFSGGESILALSAIAPGLYAESSGGRTAPRFYMRGLGNADFNDAASQPVSIVFDDVPMEKAALKSFPIFDQQNVEVIRGPQGTLFGRNTTAGIIKFQSRRPSDELTGYTKATLGSLGMVNAEAAIGGALVENVLTARVSLYTQNRSDWIDNDFTGTKEALGGFNEDAARVQFLWTPSEDFSAWLMHQQRSITGHSSTAFRANVLSTGSNKLNDLFDRDTVEFDGGGNNRADLDGEGTTLKLSWDVGDYSLSSISSYQEAERYSRGDIDGGYGCGFCGQDNGPGFVPFPVDTADDGTFEQLTQELRLASNFDGPLNFQTGLFYFEDKLISKTWDVRDAVSPADLGIRSTVTLDNTTWAVFGQGSFDISEELILTAGIRYTEDEKFASYDAPTTSTQYSFIQTLDPVSLEDENVSWDLSLSYVLDEASQIYSRIASGFRAPTIQTRIADDPDVTTAKSESIQSFEVGYKADLWAKVRLNAAIFYYIVDDIQLTAVGGNDNSVRLLNAEEGEGYGVEFDIDYLVSEKLTLSGGVGFSKTQINDGDLTTSTCGSGLCTVLDPVDENGNAYIDGNPFQHTPLWTFNLELDYVHPLADGDEVFLYVDWKFKGETNDFLYESVEYNFDTQYEGGLRVGYRDASAKFQVAVFGRNITDEENVIGGIDFNNNSAYVNEPRIWGVETSYQF